MGVAALVCGGKELRAVEPEQAMDVSTNLNSRDQCCYKYGYGNTTTNGAAKPHSHKQTSADFITWRSGESSRKENREASINSRGASIIMQTSSKAPVTMAEQIVNQYESKGLLGKGKYSHVLQVEDRSSQAQYALKVVQKLPALELEGNSYRVEVDILSQCQHPNIVSLHGVLQSADKLYLFLELALGGDVFDYLATRGSLSEARAKSVVRMVVEGVAYLHDNGITHRDLKLENLLFKSQGEESPILITDFGLAHVASNGCGSGRSHQIVSGDRNSCYMSTTCGTAEYMSPEMLEGEEYTNKVDTWAVGVVTYVLLSGSMPFEDRPERGGRGRMYQDIKMGEYSFSNDVRITLVI